METNINTEAKKRGRPVGTGVFDSDAGLLKGLREIRRGEGRYHYNNEGAALSRTLTLQLTEMEFVEPVKVKTTPGKGRAKLCYRLTPDGIAALARIKRNQ